MLKTAKLDTQNVNKLFKGVWKYFKRNNTRSRLIKHSLLRIRERYEQNLTLIDYTKMLSLVQKDRVFKVQDKPDKFNYKNTPLLIASVPYKGKFFNVLYNRNLRLIATFLPKDIQGLKIK